MRILLLLFMISCALSVNGQVRNPFLSLKFDKVVLYDYEPAGEDPSLISNGQLIKAVKIKKQVQLDVATGRSISAKLGNANSYGQAKAMCFEPHFGIVYYLDGKIIRYVLVCMDCNTLRADIDIPAQHQGTQGKGDKAYYLADGMSKTFRYFVNDLLIKYRLSHQVQAGSMFDK